MNMPVVLSKLQTKQDIASEAVCVRILDRHELLHLGATWENLIENAVEENAYYSRQYVEALLTHIDQRNVQTLTIWHGNELIALLPFTSSRWHWGGITRINMAWTTPYSMLSIPLVHKRYADVAVKELVTAMKSGARRGNLWLLRDITLDGPVGKQIVEELNARDLPLFVFDTFDRAILNHEGSFETHMKEHVSKKRRKDLVRNRKRLSELGTLRVTHHDQGAGLDQAVEAFLQIEAGGWKGEQGTALDCTSATRLFAKQAFGCHEGRSITRADMLELDGKPIAVNLSLQTGRTAFTIKCAYDEIYRNYSAGLLLEEDMIREFLNGNWADRLDSATAPGHLIQSLWNGSTKVGDLLVATGPTLLPFTFYNALEKSRRYAREKAKSLLAQLRR